MFWNQSPSSAMRRATSSAARGAPAFSKAPEISEIEDDGMRQQRRKAAPPTTGLDASSWSRMSRYPFAHKDLGAPSIILGLRKISGLVVLLLCAAVLAQQPLTPAQTARKTLRIRRFDNVKITVDGKLDEPVWKGIEPITDFVQTEPNEGKPASEKTEARVFYDDNNIYFGFTCYDSQPQLMTHRFGGHDAFTGSDSINILLDTFHDRRTGYFFSLNSRNSQFDALANEGSGQTGFGAFDATWDGIWYSATSIESWGWSAEVVIPFKSIRVSHLRDQVWGINLGRDVTRKNENDWWQPVSRFDQVARPSKAGTLVGLEGIHVGRNVELIPYFSTKYRRVNWLPKFNGPSATGGLDARYGISANLTA